jgi:hypothetical protein
VANRAGGTPQPIRRGDLFERRALAEAWAAYCGGGAEVVSFPVEVLAVGVARQGNESRQVAYKENRSGQSELKLLEECDG